MKSLLLMRHAKSVHPDGMNDHERPLNDRGRKDAPAMGRLLKDEGFVPDIIVSSTAVRALTTARLAAEACGCKNEVAVARELYLPHPNEMLQVMAAQPDDAQCIMLVSHNPSTEALVHFLTGALEPVPTAAIAHIELDIDSWSTKHPERGAKLKHFWCPRDIG